MGKKNTAAGYDSHGGGGKKTTETIYSRWSNMGLTFRF